MPEQRLKFQENGVYAALTARPEPYTYHWILFVVTNGHAETGYVLHVTDVGGKGLEFRCEYWDCPNSKSTLLFAKIGRIAEGLDYRNLLEYVRHVPMRIPAGKEHIYSRFTCRVWFKEAIEMLNRSQVFVACPDVDLLEKELFQRAHAAALLKARSRNFEYIAYKTERADAWS
ncbi:hypothetical protein NP233_g5697 [Leucocoprinus birnbaumii]|uniref:Uncharacterized protein n=1 Tax=Leucocoprinus birnbaumii TaxID=56174 RepID=A0AAD5VYH5_9AGAR|nr:hypothetical protein NP233_g5697 [Leucocoprinus birnbaumii]